MTMPITIAVDAMGGENSPDKVLEGIKIHSNLTSDIRYKVFGDKDKINSLIKKYKIHNSLIEVFHSESSIEDSDTALGEIGRAHV